MSIQNLIALQFPSGTELVVYTTQCYQIVMYITYTIIQVNVSYERMYL